MMTCPHLAIVFPKPLAPVVGRNGAGGKTVRSVHDEKKIMTKRAGVGVVVSRCVDGRDGAGWSGRTKVLNLLGGDLRLKTPARVVFTNAAGSSSSSSSLSPDDAGEVIDVEVVGSESKSTSDSSSSSSSSSSTTPPVSSSGSAPPPALYQIALTGATALWSGWTAALALAPTACLQVAFNPANTDFSGHASGLFLVAGLAAQMAFLFRALRRAVNVPGQLATPPFKMLAASLVACATAGIGVLYDAGGQVLMDTFPVRL